MTPDEGRVPDVIGEIIGWRAWRVIGARPEMLPMLASATYSDTIWHPGYWTVATCGGRDECSRSLDGGVPGESCSCGMYAAKSRSQLVGLGYGREDGREGDPGHAGLAGGEGACRPAVRAVPELDARRCSGAAVRRRVRARQPVEEGTDEAGGRTAAADRRAVMEIGTESPAIIVEPVEDPFKLPKEQPEQPAPAPEKAPAKEREPEKVPA